MSDRLTLTAAAKRYGVDRQALKKAVKRGRLLAEIEREERGPVWYTTAANVERYLASRPDWARRRNEGAE